MKYNEYRFDSPVWLYPGEAAWYFVTVPGETSRDITKMFGDRKRGWGSLPVEVRLGKSIWKTSIFPDKKAGTYVLPLKKEIRIKESINKDDNVSIVIAVTP